MTFDPDKWTTSLFRSLQEYVETNIDMDVYDLEMSYPNPENMKKRVPLPKTLIHFECDDPQRMFFGLGDNVIDGLYDDDAGTLEEWEAHCHNVVIDVGVWASIESGGTTARWEAREDLDRIFNGPSARAACMETTLGVELMEFSGGRFVDDNINDVVTLRIVDMVLNARVYSRTKKTPIPYVGSVDQSQGLVIDDTVIIG